MRLLTASIYLALGLLTAAADAATFEFGAEANSISGQTSATLSDGGFLLTLEAGPAGALLDERSQSGLGVNSSGVNGVASGRVDKFDVLTGAPPFDGLGESVTLGFDKPGVLTAIDFDGVKDEALEYFVLTTESGRRIEFFDSAANTTVPGAVDAAVTAGVVTGEIVFLLEDAAFDDETFGLTIPFAAGESLTITYAELGGAFGPTQSGNGARLQGLTVQSVPEPSACVYLLLGALSATRRIALRRDTV